MTVHGSHSVRLNRLRKNAVESGLGGESRAVGPFAKRQPTVESRRLGAVGYRNRNTRAPEARYQIR
jgi:hypothetical protein